MNDNNSPNNAADRIEDLSILTLSKEQLNILMGDEIDLKAILNAVQECNQLRPLLRQMILKSIRKEEGIDDTAEEISKWRNKRWGERVYEVFLDRKRDLDQVSYWMLVTKKQGHAMETYYQLCSGEITFQKLSAFYRGVKKEIRKPYCELHKVLQLRLRGAGTSKPQSPIQISSGYLVTKVIEQHPAELDAIMKERLLNDLETEWADRQISLRLEELQNFETICNNTNTLS